jgi:hypothetical protein
MSSQGSSPPARNSSLRHSSTVSPVRLSTGEMLIVCATVLVVFAIGVGLKTSGGKWTGDEAWIVGGDFVTFYVAGRILNEHDARGLYDFQLQENVYREVVPGAKSWTRTFAYPPFIATLFRPLARLPLRRALFVFMIVTFLVFLAALALLNVRFGSSARDERALLLLAGLSFFPFLGYTWLGAQISIIGFAAVTLALHEEDRRRMFRSGLALALCLYKPTLLVLLAPLLLMSGSIPQLLGLVAGGGLLTILWLVVGGLDSMLAFVEEIRWTLTRTTSAGQLFNPYRNVDLNAFFRLLPYGRSFGAYVLLGAIAATSAVALIATWWRARKADRPTRLLVWAATLTWTLVLNIYTPFYDTVLVVPAGAIAVAAVRAREWQGWNRLAPALLCVYVTPWIAEVSARAVRVQIYTLVLAAFGTLLLVEANRGKRPESPAETTT